MNNVLQSLKAVASGIGKQDEETFLSFYHYALSQMNSEAEKTALRLGTLAMITDACKLRIRCAYYTFLFRMAMKKLK